MDIQYIGEHLWLGTLGHIIILISFVATLLAAYSYYQSTQNNEDTSWRRMGRWCYSVHGLLTFSAIGLIFYAMLNKMYEYNYVYRTVSEILPMKYVLAAFWADQEGSFLLWMFWHIILGWALMRWARSWESSVMTTLSLIQAFLTSMLLGLYWPLGDGDSKLGSNPFALVRDVFEAPIFTNADYLSQITGQGLNPLLQNYWMTIHPPVLFLGFASMSIPFCFAIAGLSTSRHRELMSSVMRWSMWASFIFGLGIWMGAAWAYEALTFGGYWAWDPVENSSLVPWLILIAGVHTNLIANHTGRSYRATYVFYLLAFIFTIYSTFLTRSGVLGDTSVHAFTAMGLEVQLLGMIAFAVLLGAYKLFSAKDIPVIKEEEPLSSREFWMFVGALVLLFSSVLMTAATSLPVYNKIVNLFDPDFIGLVIQDQIAHHNRFQIWIGVFMAILMGGSILLRYRATNWEIIQKKVLTHIGIAAVIAALLTLLLKNTLLITAWSQYVFLFAGLFAILTNLDYLISFVKGNMREAGAGLSHLGFGILVLGILYTGLNKRTISTNPFVQKDFMEDESAQKAIVVIEDEPFFATDYWINYESDTLVDNIRTYKIDFKQVNTKNETITEFSTYPNVLYSADFTKIETPNPGTKHNLTYDVFTQASPPAYMADAEQARAIEDSLIYEPHALYPGDTIDREDYIITVGEPIIDHPYDVGQHSGIDGYDITVALPIEVYIKKTKETITKYPGLGLKDALIIQIPAMINPARIKVRVDEQVFNDLFTPDTDLDYHQFKLREGQEYEWNGKSIRIAAFDRSPESEHYEPKEGDIALGAEVSIVENGQTTELKPIYIIQNLTPYTIKDYDPSSGLHIKLSHIDPSTGDMTFHIAQDARGDQPINLLVAEDAPRTDLLIIQADVIPGINLVWLGSLLMLFGILLSFWVKYRSK